MLEEAGAYDVSSTIRDNYSAIDFKLITDDPNQFSSSCEFDDEMTMTIAQIRLPHIMVAADDDISDEERKDRTISVWSKMREDIIDIILDNTHLTIDSREMRGEGVEVRTQDGFITNDGGQTLTPHIDFTSYENEDIEDMSASISFNELVEVVKSLSFQWRTQYSHFEIVDRAQIEGDYSIDRLYK